MCALAFRTAVRGASATSPWRRCAPSTPAPRLTSEGRARWPRRGPGSVGDSTLAELRTLDAGSWFDARYAGAPVPTLQEVLDTLRVRAGLLLEVKAPNLYPGIAEAV